MKIGVLASIRGKKLYDSTYKKIIAYLEKLGHSVEHTLHITEEVIADWAVEEKESYFQAFYKKLEHCDLIVVECSFPSVNVGYGISHLLQKGKSLIVLYQKNTDGYHLGLSTFISSPEKVYVNSYDEDELLEELAYAISSVEMHMDKRFTIIFPAELMSRLESFSKNNKLPKAVFIRDIIEKALKNDSRAN